METVNHLILYCSVATDLRHAYRGLIKSSKGFGGRYTGWILVRIESVLNLWGGLLVYVFKKNGQTDS